MSKSRACSEQLLDLLFFDKLPDWYGAGEFWLALHEIEPTIDSTQEVGETAYPGYGRMQLKRNAEQFERVGARVRSVKQVQFPICGETDRTFEIGWFSIGRTQAGAGQIVRFGKLNGTMQITKNRRPQFEPGALESTES